MAGHLTVARTALAAFVVTALLAMHNFARTNGLFDHMDAFSAPGSVLPNSNIPVLQFRTGVKLLDDYLGFMVSLFWVDLDPRNVVAHTQGLHFYGTLTATWLLMVVEAHRAGHGTFFMLQTYAIEVAAELVGVGMFTPLWCIYHLSTSVTVSPRRPLESVRGFLVSPADAATLPLALLLGFGVPSAVMFCGDPAGTLDNQQVWTLIRLVHPVFVLAFYTLLRPLFAAGAASRQQQSTWAGASSLRHFYTWAIVLSAACHLTSLAPLGMRLLSPTWLKPEVMSQLDPFTLFVPKPFWQFPVKRIGSFAEGVSTFLVWDETLAAVSVVLWGFTLYYNAAKRAPRSARPSTLAVLLQGGAYGLVAGPGAAAAFFVQERDNVVFDLATKAVEKKR